MKSQDRTGKIIFAVKILAFLGMVLPVIIFVDNLNDSHVCQSEFERVSGLSGYVSAYANDDFFFLNFGHHIECTVFWEEDGYISNVVFFNGHLTPTLIQLNRYWDSSCLTKMCDEICSGIMPDEVKEGYVFL